jgi:ATP/ADP translocase
MCCESGVRILYWKLEAKLTTSNQLSVFSGSFFRLALLFGHSIFPISGSLGSVEEVSATFRSWYFQQHTPPHSDFLSFRTVFVVDFSLFALVAPVFLFVGG